MFLILFLTILSFEEEYAAKMHFMYGTSHKYMQLTLSWNASLLSIQRSLMISPEQIDKALQLQKIAKNS